VFVAGVQRVIYNTLKNIKSFSSSALITFDHHADLYVIELKVQSSVQNVVATQVDVKQFIGVRALDHFE